MTKYSNEEDITAGAIEFDSKELIKDLRECSTKKDVSSIKRDYLSAWEPAHHDEIKRLCEMRQTEIPFIEFEKYRLFLDHELLVNGRRFTRNLRWRVLQPNHSHPWWTVQKMRTEETVDWFVDFPLDVSTKPIVAFMRSVDGR